MLNPRIIMSQQLENKIKEQLFDEVQWYGYNACGYMLDDLDIIARFERSETIGDTLAMLLDYKCFSDYIEKTPEAHAKYYKALKEGIDNNSGSEFDDDEDFFPDYVDLSETETQEIIDLIEKNFH